MSDYQQASYYLPHCTPMVLLEQVLHIGHESAHCVVTVSHQGVLAPFLNAEGHLPAWYAIELMAQTIGVWRGWHGREQQLLPILGLLLGARGLHCELAQFPAGSELQIKVQQLAADEKIASFEAVIMLQDVVVAQGRLNTYEPDAAEIITLTQGEKS